MVVGGKGGGGDAAHEHYQQWLEGTCLTHDQNSLWTSPAPAIRSFPANLRQATRTGCQSAGVLSVSRLHHQAE